MVVSGLLANNLGWESVFYVEGALSLIWCFAWAFIVQDSPEEQKRFITQGEKDYIANSLGQDQSKGTKKKVSFLYDECLIRNNFIVSKILVKFFTLFIPFSNHRYPGYEF